MLYSIYAWDHPLYRFTWTYEGLVCLGSSAKANTVYIRAYVVH